MRPRYSVSGITGYLAYSSEENRSFAGLEEALEWAKARARELASRDAARRGAVTVDIDLQVETNEAEIAAGVVEGAASGGRNREAGQRSGQGSPSRILVETIVRARASGTIPFH